jgi:AraC-like DNA-binding protein
MEKTLVERYSFVILPILPLAKQAVGDRRRNTPAHEASREYTQLLCEFHARGGSLIELSRSLHVAYSGIRRRVVMSGVSITKNRPKKPASREVFLGAKDRVLDARESGGIPAYYAQLAEEYSNGVSLKDLARSLGISSATPLYYGVQRHEQMKDKNV